MQKLNQICTDPQVREVLTKIQNHIDILEKSTARVSSRAEVFGAIQQVCIYQFHWKLMEPRASEIFKSLFV